jgi:hypothetical protein
MHHLLQWRGLLLLALLLVAVPVLAQTSGSYDLDWWTIDAGNAELTAGTYTLRGAAGQPDVHTSHTESYTLRGGFVQPGAASTLPTDPNTPTQTVSPTIIIVAEPTASPTAPVVMEPTSEHRIYLPITRR